MTIDATRWAAVSPAGLAGFQHTRALAQDPGLRGILLFTQGAGVHQRDLWRWSGDRFTHIAGGIFPDRSYGDGVHGLFACYDPVHADTFLFGLTGSRPEPEARAALTGVVISSVRYPQWERTLAYPPQLADDRRVFAAFRLGDRMLLLVHDGTLLAVPDDGDTLDFVAGPIPDLDLEKYALRTAAADPDHGVVVAGSDDFDGRMFRWSADTGWTDGPATGHEGNSIVWNPVDRRVEVLCGAAPQTLRPFDQPDAEGPSLPSFTRAAPVARDQTTGTWLLLDRNNTAHIAPSGAAEFTPAGTPTTEFPFDTGDKDWQFTALSDGPLWAFKRDSGDVARLTDGHWSSASHPVDDVELATAAPKGLLLLDSDGAILRADAAGRTLQLSPPEQNVASRTYLFNDDRLGWDEAGERLVLWSGGDQETLVHQRGRWHALDTEDGPPQGESLLCANPRGLYCFADGELWLLRGDEWAQVGTDADWKPHELFWSPRHGGLWSVSNEGVGVWRDGRFQHVTDLPPGCALSKPDRSKIVLFDTSSRVAYDPVSDLLLAGGGSGAWRLSLADVVPDLRRDLLPGETLELPGLAADEHTPATPPAQTTQDPSFYVVECSGSSVWRTLSLAFSFPDLDQARILVESIGCVAPGADYAAIGSALEVVTTDFIWRLWTVQHGTLSGGLDLAAYFRVQFADGSALAPTADQREAIWEREGDAVAITVDWDAVVAAVPELREPRMGPDDVTELRIADHPDPSAPSILTHGMVMQCAERND
ncbi:hypothetical protein HDA40_006782 [Hamadaea flava]|uniref:WD40 repeat protein n=1 Tax=Hamadaea flava TaxID=1742688 RepID=A0ABV8LTS0_9ACTN|nr:hypothetical protein [Hamadaea flava]MCP2328275.1 hypothetical protein [Hamadaea flava]